MKKLILSIIILGFITDLQAQNNHNTLDSLKSLLKSSKIDTERVIILNSISESLINADSYDSASFYSEKALELSKQLNFNTGEATSLRLLGISNTCQGEYSKSLSYLFRALKIAESIKDNYLIGKTFNSIGSNYSLQEDYSGALTYFFKSLSFYYNPVIYEDIARAYHLQNRNKLSIDFYRRALACEIPEIDRAYVLNDLGDIYEQDNNLDTALAYYFEALKIAKELKNDAGLCDFNGSIGQLFMKQKKYKSSLSYQHTSLEIAKKINSKYAVWQSEKSLSETYELMGDGNNSLKFYKAYISVRDSIFSDENTKQIVRNEMTFDFEKKQAIQKAEQENKDALAMAELNRQHMQRNGFIIGMIIVFIFSIFLFRAFKKNQKAKNIIAQQKKQVEHKTKEITDSISYAKNIQSAMLPSEEYLKNNMPENFIIYKPKDIVSGDFYWAFRDGASIYFATADCTGHGVPGAMMSMLASSLLNEIVIERKITSPDKVLNTLREEIIKALNPKGSIQERKDGLDISFCRLSGNILESACANNGIYVLRNGEIIEIESNRFPVGRHITNLPFTLNTNELQDGDIIYTMSDGFCDQFGGPKGKKLMTKKFKQWILELSCLKMPEIKSELEKRFNSWIGNTEQVDDVTVFAIKF